MPGHMGGRFRYHRGLQVSESFLSAISPSYQIYQVLCQQTFYIEVEVLAIFCLR